ncbi:MAG: hypothetical protein Q8936_12150 [Bacillota bacterium]|nr:hypothetical protein [Bacillota bacterium]
MSIKESISKIAKNVSNNASSVAKTVSSSANNVIKTVEDSASVVAKKSGELVELSKLTISANSEKAKIEEIYAEIGKVVYDKFKANIYIDPDLLDKCNEVKSIESDIEDMNVKILELKKQKQPAEDAASNVVTEEIK